MAQQLKQKKGGPYPKNQQEKRRQQVYELHFEKGYSAVSIANELDVNRNTINEDIKFWQMQFASQFQDQDLGGIILKQIEKLEVQKKRLLEQLENSELEQNLRIEKMIFEIDYKITGFLSKLVERKIPIAYEEEISYEEAIEILKEIILSDRIKHLECISDDEILKQVILSTKKDTKYAHDVLRVFLAMGLSMFLNEEEMDYDLVSFVSGKGLLNAKEKDAFEQKLQEIKRKQEAQISEIKKKYSEKYGSDSRKWSYGIENNMEKEINSI